MTPEEKEYVRYRISRSSEGYEEARILAAEGHWNAAANRLYYAAFYAVSALLLTQGMSSSKHAGVRDLFNKHFIRDGVFPREMGRFSTVCLR